MKITVTVTQRQRCGCASVAVSTDGMAHCNLKTTLASMALVRANKDILKTRRMVFRRGNPRKSVIVKRR